MIGWIVEKISRSGWRTKWRRLRTLTTRASVTSPRRLRGERRRHRDGRFGAVGRATRALVTGTLTLGGIGPSVTCRDVGRRAVVARRRARQLQKHVVERRPAQPEIAHRDLRLS